ncbi:MAG TPA: TCR/Tet family MFS transporter [Xanthomonadales bacterium]|nr:TCR/Tet family MFS transporter [Xanthomonadales bacterium]
MSDATRELSGGRRRAALAFIFVTVALDMLAFGVIIPVLPHLIQQFLGGDIAKAVGWTGVFGTVFAAVQFVCTPLQGALSDRYGRRPVILISNFGLGIDFLFMALANTLPLLLVGRVVSGITAASISTANAYIADVTPPDRRAKAYGMLGATFGIGFILGPVLGGMLSHIDLRAPFWVAAGLALANFCYGLFVLPESLPAEKRTARLDLARANPVGSLLLLRRYPQVFGLAAVVLLSQFAHYVLPATFVLYADYRYHWGASAVGYVLALVGVCNAIVQAVLIGKVVPKLGERRTLLIGLTFGVLGFAWQGLAATGALSLLAVPLLALWGLAGPSTQSLMTRQIDPHEQGRLQGAVTSLVSLAGIAAPTVFTQVFAMFIRADTGPHLPGAAFLLASLLLVAAVALAWRVTRQPAVTHEAQVGAHPVGD